MESFIKRKSEVLTYLRHLSYPVTHYPEYKYYRAFFENGDRQAFEKGYFNKRKELTRLALLAILDDDSVKEKEALENMIFSICQEFTWCLPAHIKLDKEENAEEKKYTIDLFASETAFTLAEIVTVLSKSIDSNLIQLVYQTINERIFKPFLEEEWEFEKLENNWSAVCCGSVGMAALYLMPETTKRQKILARVEEAMGIFIKSFGSDGASREGVSYWQYGFRYFTYFADKYKRVTGGEKDLLAWPTIYNIACFQQKAFAYDRVVFNYSDAPEELEPAHDLAAFYYRLFGSEIKRPDYSYQLNSIIDHCGRFAPAYRTLTWSEEPATTTNKETEQYYLKDADMYIYKSKNIHFLAKGGNNDEAHNHNDLGHFIFHFKKEPIFIDLGAPLYTRDYFSDARYEFIQASSSGHSVPLIDNSEQKEGPEHFASLIIDHQSVIIDFTAAYDNPSLEKLIRKIDITPDTNQIIIDDQMKFNTTNHHVTRRFILQDCTLEKIDNHTIRLQKLNSCLDLCFSSNHQNYQWRRFSYINHIGKEKYAIILDVSQLQTEKEANYRLEVQVVD